METLGVNLKAVQTSTEHFVEKLLSQKGLLSASVLDDAALPCVWGPTADVYV